MKRSPIRWANSTNRYHPRSSANPIREDQQDAVFSELPRFGTGVHRVEVESRESLFPAMGIRLPSNATFLSGVNPAQVNPSVWSTAFAHLSRRIRASPVQ